MYGRQPCFRPPSGGRGTPGPSFRPPPPPFDPNSLIHNFSPYQQNPNFIAVNNPFLQNSNSGIQNFTTQNSNIYHQQYSNTCFPPQVQRRQSLENIERAVAVACRNLLAAGENISSSRVSEDVLLALQAKSWEWLGFQIHEVPSLNSLMVREGKIDAFIHCFVAVRRITSLYDLEIAICKNEGVEKFEQLEFGPFLRHPLVLHYFSVNADMAVFKITGEEIVSYLVEFMDIHKKTKNVKVEQLLDFIAKKRSVSGREKLGVRIQNLGLHVSVIQEAKSSEDIILRKCLEASKNKSKKKMKRRPLLYPQRGQLNERFNTISERVKSFSSQNEDFCGKHIRFVSSSSSEDEESEESKCEDKIRVKSCEDKRLQKIKSSMSSCPYPSASEEMTRLGLKLESDCQPSPASGSQMYNSSSGPFRKKRKCETSSGIVFSPGKHRKKNQFDNNFLLTGSATENEVMERGSVNRNRAELSLDGDSVRMFITTWTEACREGTPDNVFERMLHFYDSSRPEKKKKKKMFASARQRKKVKEMFSSYPCIGLLNVAVKSIKYGMWDSMYDTFQTLGHHELSDQSFQFETIDVEPIEKDALPVSEHISDSVKSITIDEIMGKIATYFEINHNTPSSEKTPLQNKFTILKKLFDCQGWLKEEFSIKDFKCLGYGEFFTFLEIHSSLLPKELIKCMSVNIHETSPFEVSVKQHQLVALLSQASNSLWENETITIQKIVSLLMRQFPLLSFKVIENDSIEDLLDTVRKQKSSSISRSVLFSAAMLGTSYTEDPLAHNEKAPMENTAILRNNYVKQKDAVEMLLKAPMLTDLNSWTHWDLIFAPSLGPLVAWLSTEVNSKDLLCLVTKDGKTLRIDPSATVDSFLEALLQISPFQTAVQLLSLFSLFGGERHVPISLLKRHAGHAFEIILSNTMENSTLTNRKGGNLNSINKESPVAVTFILDCLSYLPSEFRSFACDVLLSGMQSVTRNAAKAVLCECNLKKDQRLILHEVGLSLGIAEWIDDYHTFCSNTNHECIVRSKDTNSNGLDKFDSSKGETLVSSKVDLYNEEHVEVSPKMDLATNLGENSWEKLLEIDQSNEAAVVIESIRREEFGLDPSLTAIESNMLKKQHARLGRALLCLSQELYSQDSHFLLELVQNADDNIYPKDVEPTLTFILQETGIIILNNERGFSAQNIRALCDVGNSTKKGSSAGYIGQKGIGFKSVFRVTDAPEIHSNGFHVKFDITEGQIGFVLPTLIPPCDIDLFKRLAAGDMCQLDNSWNTCIVLPFRSKLLEGTSMNNIMSMFSDLHPSLLLFLHRLQCIKFRNMLTESLIVLRKEIVGDGIIKVSHGNEKMSWFVASKKLQANSIRPDVETTEISIALTLEESEKSYIPHLEQQPVFAFLPLRIYGLKFILQGDFILTSSREEVDGDSHWNQFLLSEFPSLFVSAEKSFCALPCFRDNLGKAVSAYMSFVPLMGEVHGFFSCLPRMIISKLRTSNCLILEGDSNEWVPPCKVLRNWNEEARMIFPDSLLREHLGLGFLNKDIVLPDPLARSLGIEEFGPKILLQTIHSLCRTENGLQSMGLGWLSSWLNALYTMSFQSLGRHSSENAEFELDLLRNLRKIPFIPLSDGTYSSVDEGTIWLPSDALSAGLEGYFGPETFPVLYAQLRTINPVFVSSSTVDLLHKIGIQRLSAHDIIKVHLFETLSDDKNTEMDVNLMTEYLSFVMVHLQSSCHSCLTERGYIISELRRKALILTNYGYKRAIETSLHFSKEFGNPLDVDKIVSDVDFKWHEVDTVYLKHPITVALPSGLTKWREFFKELGATDFLQVIPVQMNVDDISHKVLKDKEVLSHSSIAKDWESHELVQLLSLLSSNCNKEGCKYLLEILDSLWDDYYSDKASGYCNVKSTDQSRPFKSSFMRSICDNQWIVSTFDGGLHYPKDLFYDCDAVCSILGVCAPYAVPKLKSGKLLSDIGFKTQVTLEDTLAILQVWRKSKSSFKASIVQMSRFYTFIWKEMATSKLRIIEEFNSGPFIFIPYNTGSTHDDFVSGVFLSPKEVYWHDSTGSSLYINDTYSQERSKEISYRPFSKMLSNIYPFLYDFFVNECEVPENPPFLSYVQMLQHLSNAVLPSQAANVVFRVFLKWAHGLNSGIVSPEDISYLKESLLTVEFAILPTVLDKWVSLHPSFGLVCWCDDENLRKEFKHSQKIDFLYFGELSNFDEDMRQSKFSILIQTLGIPALSQVVIREAISFGAADCNVKASLVNWILPYAQRYIFNVHSDKYLQLKQTVNEKLITLQVVIVEKLFYRNVIKRCPGAESKKRFECSCLLQGSIFYTTREADSHSVFMELSRLFFDGVPNLHMANFLHMITTMVESGSTEEQTEFFILNSQKLAKLSDEESIWFLPSISSVEENDDSSQNKSRPMLTNPQNSSKPKRKPGIDSIWPPVDWKTAPDINFARANGYNTQPSQIGSLQNQIMDESEVYIIQTNPTGPTDGEANWVIEDDSSNCLASDPVDRNSGPDLSYTVSGRDQLSFFTSERSSTFSERDQLSFRTPTSAQAILTGRIGELIAFKYLSGKIGEKVVKWVNEENETGLPYDIVIENKEKSKEYIEVKATKSKSKDWFFITTREWQYAVEKGESFSIAHVVLAANNVARMAIFKDPLRLCQLGKLQLAVMMPQCENQREYSVVT